MVNTARKIVNHRAVNFKEKPRNPNGVKKKKPDAKKIIGEKINRGVDGVGNKLIGGGSKIVHKIGDSVIKRGGDKNLVDMGKKYIIKHGSRLIREGAGKAKNLIHTAGREAVGYAASKIKETGSKIKDKWNSWTNNLKRKR